MNVTAPFKLKAFAIASLKKSAGALSLVAL
jgi:hypothetical protein